MKVEESSWHKGRIKSKIGDVFHRLTIIDTAEAFKRSGTRFLCRCECGNERVVKQSHLRAETIKSCGCLISEITAKRNASHGKSKTRIYNIWASMKARCFNPKKDKYKYYGGRGVTVCERWRNSFENFLADMGEPPSARHSIDRINNDGNYEPSNCRWATPLEQAHNKRNING
jgi:hypothetical protein